MNKIVLLFLLVSNIAYSQIEQKTIKKDTVELQPEFPGGQNEMFKFIGRNMHYPANPREQGIMGTIYVGFVVDSTGKIENPTIKAQRLIKLKKKKPFQKQETETVESDADLAEECIRIVKLMPIWKPATQNGKAVRVAYTLPLKFKLE